MVIKTPPVSKQYRDNYDRVFAKGYQPESYADGFRRVQHDMMNRPMVDAPLEYNTDAPLYMSDGKVVLLIKTLDGDIEI